MFVFHLGVSGFPYGTAQIQRIRLTFKSLKLAGCNPLIINKHSVYKTENTKKINRFEDIFYINTSVSKSRPDNFIGRNLNKLAGYVGEIILLFKKRKSLHTAIYYDSSFSDLVYYRLLSKVLGFKLIIQYVEFRSAIPAKTLLTRINCKLFDTFCFYFCDGIIVISEFLREITIRRRKSLPILKVPAICDFSEFDVHENAVQRDYLMYCGAIGYLPVIVFIIELFCKLKDLNVYNGNLVFAIGMGKDNKADYNYLTAKIASCKYRDQIELNVNVPYNSLITMYLGAELLIVPMRNTIQDIAGFHHKVGEYTAAAKPIISNKAGEIKHYFTDGISAILAEEYSIESYLTKLSERLPLIAQLNTIAENGHKVGLNYLNYKTYSTELKSFICNL